MPTPRGSVITVVSGSTKIPLVVGDVRLEFVSEPWERPEKSNARKASVREADGGEPQYVTGFGGRRINILVVGCGDPPTARDTSTDDDNLDEIQRRWDIRRYQITGDTNYDANVIQLYELYKVDLIKFKQYEASRQSLNQDVSVTYLETLALETYSNLQSTTLRMFGKSISPLGKLDSSVLLGATSLPVTSAESWVIGQQAILDPNGAGEEVVTVTGVAPGTLTVTATVNAHAGGTVVQLYEPNLLITAMDLEVEREIPRADGVSIIRKTWTMTIESREDKAASA